MSDAKETAATLLAGLAVAAGGPFGRRARFRKVCDACREEIQTGQGYRVADRGFVHARCPQAGPPPAPEAAGGGGGGGVCPEG